MLSQSNIDKLIMTGLYRHEVPAPDSGYGHDPRWCKNWTFTVHEYKGIYRMRDTYWSSGDSLSFELTDENFTEFSFIFDFDKVSSVHIETWLEYPEDKRFCEAVDSGGYSYSKYFVFKDAKPSKELKRTILINEIHSAESILEYKHNELARLDTDGMNGFYE